MNFMSKRERLTIGLLFLGILACFMGLWCIHR